LALLPGEGDLTRAAVDSASSACETIRQWAMRFGPAIAGDLRSRRPRPHGQWHLDEMFVSIGGKWMYLWRAVDAEGEVLDCLVQSCRDKRAAKKLMRKLLKKQGFAPSHLVTDDLKSWGSPPFTIEARG